MAHTLHHLVLRNAIELIRVENRWTRFEYARKANGGGCDPWDEEARAWCALGALEKCAFDLVGTPRRAKNFSRATLLADEVDTSHIWYLNDMRGHAATLKFLDKMAAKRFRFGERLLVMREKMEAHRTRSREARERERMRRIFTS